MALVPRRKREEESLFPVWPREFERFFEDIWPSRWLRTSELCFDVAETENEVVVTTELPGVEAKDVEITVSGDVLTIRGEKKEEKDEKKKNFRRMERWYGSFGRSITLPSTVDADKISAKMKNGVLTVTLPKREEEKPKAIKIEAE